MSSFAYTLDRKQNKNIEFQWNG